MRDVKLILMGAALVGMGVATGSALSGARVEAQAQAWHSCIVADAEPVNGHNGGEMLGASGEHRVMVPAGYEPIGGGGSVRSTGPREGFVVLCRR